MPYRTWKSVPTAIYGNVDISEVPVCHLLLQMRAQRGQQTFFQDWCLINSQPAYKNSQHDFNIFNSMNYSHIIIKRM